MLIEVPGRKNGGWSDKEVSRSASTRLVVLSKDPPGSAYHCWASGQVYDLSTLETPLHQFRSMYAVLDIEHTLLDISLYGETLI
jgi:hypothetical protein